ncbi:MAG: short-chain dehydrogenase/reductase [Solirubrobacterales bacterium]|nr:short-chain dehydrogenase/reductase [Solirubrobacterales bacterium]
MLVARREDPLDALARRLEAGRGVEVRTIVADLADRAFPAALAEATADIEVGAGVYNAAYSYVAPLLERPAEDALRVVDVNVRGPLLFVHQLAPAMVARGRGGIVLMSSLAGNQGSPRLAAYAASKAFTTTLAESLWGELAPQGVDVLACVAGAIRTPGYASTLTRDAPGTLDPPQVAEAALDALGHGPVVTPGATNRVASFAMRRLLPRRRAVAIMRRSLEGLEPE